MNVLGLTGRNMEAMADVAEVLLQHVTNSGHSVAICLYIENAAQAVALRRNAIGLSEIWRIGPDASRPDLDEARLIEATLDDSDPARLRELALQHLTRFLHLVNLYGTDAGRRWLTTY